MKHPEAIARRLERVRAALPDNAPELAAELDASIAELRESSVATLPPGGLMTTGEAARRLGVRSVNTVKRWVADGLLDGFHLGGRILVASQSVECLIANSTVRRQAEWERGLDEALAAFDAGEEELPPSDATSLGRKPWENAEAASQDEAIKP